MPFVYPAHIGEVVGIQTGHQLGLVAEIAVATPETHTGLVPGAGQYGVLTLRTGHSEKVQRLVVGIVQTHRHHNVAGPDVGMLTERLLNPELLQFHLAAFLGLLLPLAAFLVFLLVGDAGAAVLKLYLRAEGPALAKVVT